MQIKKIGVAEPGRWALTAQVFAQQGFAVVLWRFLNAGAVKQGQRRDRKPVVRWLKNVTEAEKEQWLEQPTVY